MRENRYGRIQTIMLNRIERVTNKMAGEFKGTAPFDKDPVSNDDLLMEYETKGFETFSQIANEQGLDAGIAYRDKMEELKTRRNYAR